VITVHTSTPYKDIVRLMQSARISAVPVLDERDRLVGIISEADLLLKEEHATHDAPRFLGGRHRADHSKARGEQAWELMSAPVIAIEPHAPIGQAARLMHRRDVKRLVVVDEEDRIVGIVSRRDLLSVFLRSDPEIGKEIMDDVIKRRWMTPEEAHLHVAVEDGRVELTGRVDRKSALGIIIELIRGIDGVVSVENHVSFDLDDTRIDPQQRTAWGILPRALQRP
jgi:CBS-domain-containing membrane protein